MAEHAHSKSRTSRPEQYNCIRAFCGTKATHGTRQEAVARNDDQPCYLALNIIYPTFDDPSRKATFTGHVYITTGYHNGAHSSWGYYPAFHVLGRDAVSADDRIENLFDLYKPVRGLIVDETNRISPVDETVVYALDHAHYQKVMRRIDGWRRYTPTYVLGQLNCVSFALDIVKTAGFDPPRQIVDMIDTPIGLGIGINLEKWRLDKMKCSGSAFFYPGK